MIISHLNKLWKAKFFTLCDVIFLVRLQEKFEIDHSWEWKGSLSLPSLERYCISAVMRIGQASRGWANPLMDTYLKSGQAKMSNLSKTYGTPGLPSGNQLQIATIRTQRACFSRWNQFSLPHYISLGECWVKFISTVTELRDHGSDAKYVFPLTEGSDVKCVYLFSYSVTRLRFQYAGIKITNENERNVFVNGNGGLGEVVFQSPKMHCVNHLSHLIGADAAQRCSPQ